MKTNLVDQIERSFTYQAPKADQPERYTSLRAKAKELALMVEEMCPAGREQSVAITKIEEAIMWANKAIAVGEA